MNRVETLVRRFDRVQQSHPVLGFPWAVMAKFGNDQAGGKAALVAYYGLFALFPALLLLATILGYVLSGDPGLRDRILDTAVANFPIIGADLRKSAHPLEGSTLAVVIGVIGTVYGVLGLSQAAMDAMNTVWNIPYARWPSFFARRLRGLALLAMLGVGTVASTALAVLATAVVSGPLATALSFMGSIAINFGVFLVAFMVLTAEPLSPGDVLLGVSLATAGWQTLQAIGVWFVGRQLQHASNTYGFFGVVIALLVWLYTAAQLTLWSAEINVVRRYRLWPRSVTQPPLIAGDKATFARLAQMEVRRPEVRIEVTFTAEAERDPLAPPADSAPADSPPADSPPADSAPAGPR